MTRPLTTSSTRRVATDHRVEREKLTALTAQVVANMWDRVDPDHIVNSWATQLPEATAIVSGAQLAAARTADPYVGEALEVQDLDGEVEGTVAPEAFAGVASDGGPLLSLLTNPVFLTLATIADGLDVTTALSRGKANLQGIVRTQVADAGRYADQTSLVAHRGAEGYVRVTDGNPCARCLLLAGKYYRWNRGFLRHPRCGCMHVPTLIANPRFLEQTARDLYDAMTVEQRTAAGFTRGMQHALDEGADINQVVNALTRRGAVYEAGGRQFTLEGTTRLGGFGRAARRQGRSTARITPNEIFRTATSREDAIALLRQYGYLLDTPVVSPGFAAVQLRPSLMAARTTQEVGDVLAAEYLALTGRRLEVSLTGSLPTAREHAEGILRVVERYPATPLRRVQTGPLPFARYAESERGVITFSDHWSSIEGRPRYVKALKADADRGFHPYRSADGVASHEVVHILDPDVPIESIVGRREVTGYAARSEHEAVAEAVADVMVNGPNASLLSREIVDAVDDAYVQGRIVGRRPRLARPGPPSRLSPPARPQGPPARRAAEAELNRLTVPQLKAMARERGIPGYTAMRKQELVDALSGPAPVKAAKAVAKKAPAKKAPAPKPPKPLPAPERMTPAALRKELEAAGVDLPAKVAKPDLQRWVEELRAAAPAERAAVAKRLSVTPADSGKLSPEAAKLPKVTDRHDVRAQAMAANPRYGDAYEGPITAEIEAAGGVGYTNNCTRVVIAQEMRRRGIAVTAGAGTPLGDVTAAYVRTFRLEGRYATRVADDLSRNMSLRDIVREVESWPPGSRGVVTLRGHTVNVERDALTGRAVFVDAQAAKSKNPVMDAAAFGRRVKSRGAPTDRWMAVARVDDLDLSDYGLRYVESPELDLADGHVGKTEYPRIPGSDRLPSYEEIARMRPDDRYVRRSRSGVSGSARRRRRPSR